MRSRARGNGTRRVLGVIGAVAASLSVGCGRQAIATTDALPVVRVVVYRNGVAYFERAGRVDGDDVRFKMKPSELGDFLATLAVMERGGSSVKAAAFPLKMDDDNQEAKPPHVPTDDEKRGLDTVVLSLDGKGHDLKVGYVAESPVWRPSYRIVTHGKGDADLQVWGVVENLSGEDWNNVHLALVAGAPLAFQSELGTPVIPPRPVVTDEGEVIAAVPRAETSLQQEPPSPAPPPPSANGALAADESIASAPSRMRRGGALMKTASPSAPAAAAAPAPMGASSHGYAMGESSYGGGAAVSAPRSVASLAALAVEGGATQYDLPSAVTIPDKSATMVMLLSRQVSGDTLFLFAPDAGVPDSASHPFRVARFTNSASGALERGPIAVFEEGAFLGQGMVDPLPAGATATVPFALERGIAVDETRKYDEAGARIAKIEDGNLTIERDRVTKTTYRVRNGGDQAAKLLVKHPRILGARLFGAPKGTEDNVGTRSALVPATVEAHATSDVVVDERATQRMGVDYFSPVADTAVKAYLADPKSDRGTVQKLATAWVTRNDIVAKTDERKKLQVESNTLSSGAEETRRNLRAIEKNKTAGALRQKLTTRLTVTSGQLDDINRKAVELDAKLAELEIVFKDAMRSISIKEPSTPPTS